jgi:hypothetical protein
MLEQKLQEELNRYKAINKYGKKMIMEQDAPPDPAAAGGEAPPDPGAAPAPDPAAAGAPMDPAAGAPPPPGGAAPAPGAEPAPGGAGAEKTEEMDITDLVNMVKSIKNHQEQSGGDNSDVTGKMDDVFTKLNDLESKLGVMDQLINKIDQLGSQVQQIKPKTEQEKLEMRSLDSYPFSQNPQQFFAQKQPEMQAAGKNEYVLTKNDVDDYSNNMIRDTFGGENTNNNESKF